MNVDVMSNTQVRFFAKDNDDAVDDDDDDDDENNSKYLQSISDCLYNSSQRADEFVLFLYRWILQQREKRLWRFALYDGCNMCTNSYRAATARKSWLQLY